MAFEVREVVGRLRLQAKRTLRARRRRKGTGHWRGGDEIASGLPHPSLGLIADARNGKAGELTRSSCNRVAGCNRFTGDIGERLDPFASEHLAKHAESVGECAGLSYVPFCRCCLLLGFVRVSRGHGRTKSDLSGPLLI
jgi:hypothetical protein